MTPPLARPRLVPLLLATLLAWLSQPAIAADWKLISETEDPEKIISWYVDMTSIVRDDDYLRAFLRTTWSVPQHAEDGTAYQSSTYLNYFDCDARKIAYTGNAYFAGAEPEDLPVHEEPEKPVSRLKFQSVLPGSAGAMRLDFVCQFRSKNFLTQTGSVDPHG